MSHNRSPALGAAPQRNDADGRTEEEEEEDWSEFAKLGGGFARFERRTVRIGAAPIGSGGTCALSLECQPSLSPLDMLDLGDGSNDATGHVVWMGALLLLEALRCPGAWASAPTPEDLFAGKDALELGCGTGIAGLAILVTFASAAGTTRAVSSSDELEEYIIREASLFGLRHASTVRPGDILRHGRSGKDPSSLNDVTLEEMKDAGAAILTFQKVTAKADGGRPD